MTGAQVIKLRTLLQAHLVTGNYLESAHERRSDARLPVHKLRLQVAYNTPVRDERAGVTAEGHPSSQATADAGEQYPASARVQTCRRSVYWRSDVADVNRRKRESRRAAGVRDRNPARGQLLPHRRVSLAWTCLLDDVEVTASRHGPTFSRLGDTECDG